MEQIELERARVLNERTETRKGGPVSKFTIEVSGNAPGVSKLRELVGENVKVSLEQIQGGMFDEDDESEDDAAAQRAPAPFGTVAGLGDRIGYTEEDAQKLADGAGYAEDGLPESAGYASSDDEQEANAPGGFDSGVFETEQPDDDQ